jgi:hypothetical protein
MQALAASAVAVKRVRFMGLPCRIVCMQIYARCAHSTRRQLPHGLISATHESPRALPIDEQHR